MAQDEVDECSTPFGITDYCARLDSRRIEEVTSNSVGCSTPFGITDYCARHGPLVHVVDQLEVVLNAFRHHRLLRVMVP